jgi:PIN domain nuclease of toxin-antitoxin system
VIVLDTHVLLWWTNTPQLLSTAADDALTTADVVAVSAITVLEIAILHRRSRIQIDDDPLSWIRDLGKARGLRVLPVTTEVGVRAGELQEILRDPMDCLIVATALTHGVPLVTKDERIQRSGGVATIW